MAIIRFFLAKFASSKGINIVADDDFLSMKDAKDSKFQVMTSSMNVMGRELQMDSAVRLTPDDATAEDYSDVANNYMTMARGVKAYNDEALKGINEKYKNDPEKLETAKAGLGNLMTHASENMYGIIGDSNKMNNFLSEADKKELDNMHLQGVTTTYSEIMVNGPYQIYVESRGKLYLTDIQFKDTAHLMQIIDRIRRHKP